MQEAFGRIIEIEKGIPFHGEEYNSSGFSISFRFDGNGSRSQGEQL
jgi:hypothetical protein